MCGKSVSSIPTVLRTAVTGITCAGSAGLNEEKKNRNVNEFKSTARQKV